MFTDMMQRSEQLFISPVEPLGDEVLLHLPTVMEALANIIAQLDEVWGQSTQEVLSMYCS